MAQSYVVITPQGGPALASAENTKSAGLVDPFQDGVDPAAFFGITDWSMDVEQSLNIGSQATGAGAGKVTFNPFSITRRVDSISPTLFSAAARGQLFQFVDLIELRAGGNGGAKGARFVAWRFGMAAVKTVSWSQDEEGPRETVTFEYGSLAVQYSPQNPDGSIGTAVKAGWDRVLNKQL
jgi:type VI protein secretion system component Hcp